LDDDAAGWRLRFAALTLRRGQLSRRLNSSPVLIDGTHVKADLVTASRVDMVDRAATFSHANITRAEMELLPIYRAGQLFESNPGLVVTLHSGEGRA
jgi:hypothetical protein